MDPSTLKEAAELFALWQSTPTRLRRGPRLWANAPESTTGQELLLMLYGAIGHKRGSPSFGCTLGQLGGVSVERRFGALGDAQTYQAMARPLGELLLLAHQHGHTVDWPVLGAEILSALDDHQIVVGWARDAFAPKPRS